jgi:hypothetical protein
MRSHLFVGPSRSILFLVSWDGFFELIELVLRLIGIDDRVTCHIALWREPALTRVPLVH